MSSIQRDLVRNVHAVANNAIGNNAEEHKQKILGVPISAKITDFPYLVFRDSATELQFIGTLERNARNKKISTNKLPASNSRCSTVAKQSELKIILFETACAKS